MRELKSVDKQINAVKNRIKILNINNQKNHAKICMQEGMVERLEQVKSMHRSQMNDVNDDNI